MPAHSRSDRSPLLTTGWLLTAALIAFRLLPGLFQPGMFFDGVTHATISRNLAIGVGDPWHPVFSAADGAGYHEQPPLGFVLESFFFRLLGDHFWVEKLYSALTGIVTAALIAAVWQRLVGASARLRDLAWLPVALWVILPGWGWMYENNLLENTLGMLAVFAVYAILRAGDSRRAAPAWLAAGAAGIAAAVLSKGPVGLFPLATPLVAHFTLSRRTLARAMAENTALVALLGAALGLVCLIPGAAEYLDKYLHEQLFASLRGQREVVGSALGRFDIIWKMLKELILPAAVAAGLIWAARRSGFQLGGSPPPASTSPRSGSAASNSRPLPLGEGRGEGTANRSAIAFCLLTAASASFPIMASPKQSGHYVFPSYAFYALAIALWCAPAVIQLLAEAGKSAAMIRRHRLLRRAATAVLALLAIATWLMAGRPHRDQGVYHDSLVLGKILPKSSIVGLTDDLANDWPLQTNLARWDSIGADRAAAHPYILSSAAAPPPLAGYAEVPTEMSRYRLFKLAVDPGSLDSLRETKARPVPRK